MNINDLILDQTLDCGQCFRWNRNETGEWVGVVGDRLCIMSQDGESSQISGIEPWMDSYFDLTTDYGLIKKDLAERDEVLKKAIKYGEGIRILNQDLHETLFSFIISQNNNIPRIKGCIEKLSGLFGEPIGEYRQKTYYSFPDIEKLASLSIDDLAEVRLGYRAPYIIETARTICDEGYIREDLGSYKGVGPKVKSCIELFGRHNLEAFPIDVWVKRVMNQCYGFDESDVKGMAKYADENFAPYGGIAQQYLFYYIRMSGQN